MLTELAAAKGDIQLALDAIVAGNPDGATAILHQAKAKLDQIATWGAEARAEKRAGKPWRPDGDGGAA